MMEEVEHTLSEKVSTLLRRDPFRMRCLDALRQLNLPQGYIGAGFLRNAIWDSLHDKTEATPLNDVDVIYFCQHSSRERDSALEAQLSHIVPRVNWQVKNQARMHNAHGHNAYENCEEAISYWVERETCVAARLNKNDGIDVLAPFGLSANFEATVSMNPKCSCPEVFSQRIIDKNWLMIWPKLTVKEA